MRYKIITRYKNMNAFLFVHIYSLIFIEKVSRQGKYKYNK